MLPCAPVVGWDPVGFTTLALDPFSVRVIHGAVPVVLGFGADAVVELQYPDLQRPPFNWSCSRRRQKKTRKTTYDFVPSLQQTPFQNSRVL